MTILGVNLIILLIVILQLSMKLILKLINTKMKERMDKYKGNDIKLVIIFLKYEHIINCIEIDNSGRPLKFITKSKVML